MENKKFFDMDGNELNIGDIVLFGTGDKRIARAEIVEISDYGWLKLHALKNRKSSACAVNVLLDKKSDKNESGYKSTEMVLMDISNGHNIEITREMVDNSIDTFVDKPVVYNPNQELKDYTNDKIVKDFYCDNVVGFITGVKIVDKQVIGEVIWYNDIYIRDKYNNWNIQLTDDRSEFVFCGVEIF